jgi:hypothetical protein
MLESYASMDGRWNFSHLNRANYHIYIDQMIALLRSEGLWMYLEKPLPALDNDHYDLVCMKKDEALGLITLYVEPDFVHNTENNRSAKQIWHTFHNLFSAMNTTQVNRLET